MTTSTKWFAAQVTRPDAGGLLYGVIRYENNEPIEADVSPSYDRDAMQRVADRLNNAAALAVPTKYHTPAGTFATAREPYHTAAGTFDATPKPYTTAAGTFGGDSPIACARPVGAKQNETYVGRLRAGVEWIALNDNAGDDGPDNPDALNNVAGYISTLLLADLFDVSAKRIAEAVMRLRGAYATTKGE